jgi:capsular exopolysaccharide synthesis family protein
MDIQNSYARSTGFSDRGAVGYLRAFRQHWLLMASLVVLAVASTALITYTQTKQYTASADVQITPVSANDTTFQGFSLFRQPQDGSSIVLTAARVMSAAAVQKQVERTLGHRHSGVSTSIDPLSQADIVAVTAKAPNPQVAATVANTYARVFVAERTGLFHQELRDRIAALKTQIDAIPVAQRAGNFTYSTLQGNVATLQGYLQSPDPTVGVLAPANPPSSPSSPRPKLNLAIALVASLLLALGVAILLEFADPRVSGEDELRLVQRLPILARVPRLRGRIAHDYLMGIELLPGDAWKAYRTLRAVLATAGRDGGYPRSIAVTSASPGDGKTMTAVNLAITLASANLKVILVDGDFHRPMIGSIFNVAARPHGLTRVLSKRDDIGSVLVPAPSHARLELLLANRDQVHDLQLLDGERVSEVLGKLAERADVVVIDTPPLPEVAEALSMVAAAEAVLVAVRVGHTRRDKLEQLRELLDRRRISPLGFIVTTRHRPEVTGSEYEYMVEAGRPVPLGPREAAASAAARISRTLNR